MTSVNWSCGGARCPDKRRAKAILRSIFMNTRATAGNAAHKGPTVSSARRIVMKWYVRNLVVASITGLAAAAAAAPPPPPSLIGSGADATYVVD